MKGITVGALLSFLSTITPSFGADLPYRLLHEFSDGTWIENLCVRSNGNLLVTSLTPNASVYQVSQPTTPRTTVSLVHMFDSIDGLGGITETLPDVFVTFGGNFSALARPKVGTFSVFEIDLRRTSEHNLRPAVRLVAAIPEAVFPNGVQTVPDIPTTILIADSTLGLVWRLDTLSGDYEVGIQVPEMAVVPEAPYEIGINGLHIHNGYIYWTNSFAATIYRIQIDGLGRAVPGAEAETVINLSSETTFLDDMTLGPFDEDIIWAMTNLDDTIIAVRPDGSFVVVDGSKTELSFAGGTACKFGRTDEDSDILYVVTSGGIASPINGTLTVGGEVLAVDTSSFR